MKGSNVWWRMESSNVWWPLEGKGKGKGKNILFTFSHFPL
jgi:hypothetical protein